ncbi:hypothetical protein U1Q18_032509 [Sarracenia purpurea var. burkii]
MYNFCHRKYHEGASIAGIARDWRGARGVGLMAALGGFCPLTTEFMGISHGLKTALQLHVPRLVLESDSLECVNAIQNASKLDYNLIRSIQGLMHGNDELMVKDICREPNTVAKENSATLLFGYGLISLNQNK